MSFLTHQITKKISQLLINSEYLVTQENMVSKLILKGLCHEMDIFMKAYIVTSNMLSVLYSICADGF